MYVPEIIACKRLFAKKKKKGSKEELVSKEDNIVFFLADKFVSLEYMPQAPIMTFPLSTKLGLSGRRLTDHFFSLFISLSFSYFDPGNVMFPNFHILSPPIASHFDGGSAF
ncbi:hypothetical protein IscW_ISCW006689 [Ixodes scapularis]|uniref:Uncharacterized protein n=1 Tax=Ixodes scapularis TaxID=6945 RepID=B7PQ40_IXOSC|nr:hypothetical protein IscW_ISCW006689 [Ixodes scapularis]|eukprot:XP_002435882.1 hypothetical protein IscW_ISCW006689 [Ixodes scapularis]